MRIDLGPSRLLAATLLLLGVASGAGLFLTDLTPWLAAPMSAACLAYAGVLAHAEATRPALPLVLRADGGVFVDGRAAEGFRLGWQGGLACFDWMDGDQRRRRIGWPDVLDAAARRELRLWALGRGVRASTAAVAP